MDNKQQLKAMIGRDNIFRLFFATSGRINRRMYIQAYVLLLVSFGVFYLSASYLYPAILTIMLILIVSTAAISDFILTFKRLKDIGLPAKLAVLKVILNFTGIGLVATVILSIVPGRKRSNRYGEPPFKVNAPIRGFRKSAFRFNTRIHRFMFVQYNVFLLLLVLVLAMPLAALVYLGIVPLGGVPLGIVPLGGGDAPAGIVAVTGGIIGGVAQMSGNANANLSLSTMMMIVPIAYLSALAALYFYGFLALLKNRVNDIGLRKGTTLRLTVLLVSLIALDIVHTMGVQSFLLTLLAGIVSTVFLVSFIYLIFAPSEKMVNAYGRRSRELIPSANMTNPEYAKQ